MTSLNYNTHSLQFSTYMSLHGSFEFKAAIEYKKIIANYIHPNKDLYLDLKEVESIDIIGLNSLIMTKLMVKAVGGEFFIFTTNGSGLIQLMDQIKLKDQLNFRDIIIQDSFAKLAS